MRRSLAALAMFAIVAALTGCGADAADSLPAATTSGVVRLPPTQGVFDYQLGGAYDLVQSDSGEHAPDVVARDATAAAPSTGYGICYVNGFQTQPGEASSWTTTRDSLLLHDADGQPETDPAWPDEYILDPSAADQRDGILAVIGPLIDGCARSGFAAVEIDNLDTWTRFDRIDPEGAQVLARAYVERAHSAGLAIAQKNAAEIARIGHDKLGFDFAVVEECAAFHECGEYTQAYGTHVLQIEYPDSLKDAGIDFSDVCADPDRAALAILRDRVLLPRGEPGYIYDRCP
ncbi:endo alpha-1,4 polygalactosaminidase [Microbacterium sp. NPDC089698]|uniref:endo alpha-1,4 polygalactosaminidase n=1 Tax=Microbacterium sp. NPDC089698 TaxID=3364200 RepID=UPI003826C9AF